jgi:choline dehydrogenase-like flavoprotein
MPHVDFLNVEDPSILDCDLCIIGTGPAGCTIARELSTSKMRVTLLESGGFERQKHIDALNEIESIGSARTMDQWRVRNRIVGGSSHTWTGRCAPFDEIDFERRDWIPYSGWPFNLDSLTPYLDRTTGYLGLGIGSGFNDERFWKLAGRTPPVPESAYLLPFFWQASRDDDFRRDFMRFGRHLLRHLGENVTLVTNATVAQINSNEAGSAAASIDIISLRGGPHRIKARAIVVCAGGIENARLLLASDNLMTSGLGNQNDMVGRFLMDHLRGPTGHFPKMSRSLQKRFGTYKLTNTSGDNLFKRGFRLSPEIQRQEELVNCSAFLREVISPNDPWNAFARLINGADHPWRNSARIAMRPGHFVRAVHNYFISRNPMPHKLERLELVCMCEQIPDRNSRLTLSEKRDQFGMRLSKIDWRINKTETHTIKRMSEFVSTEFAHTGKEVPILDDWIKEDGPFPASSFPEVAHPMGTTRMSDNPQEGVVDRDCQVHGVRGLYIAGSSVFPTGGHCNPTQMIVALAIRLADTLKLRANPQ